MAVAIAPIVVALGVTGVAAAILTEVIVIAIGLGISMLASTLFASKPAQPKPSDGQVNYKQAAAPRIRSYGRVKVGGLVVFANTSGGWLHRVFALGSGEIDAVEEHWLDDNLVTLSSGAVTSPPYAPGGVSKVLITHQLGTDSPVAYASLIAAYPAQWTSAHLGKGIPSALVEMYQVDSEDMGDIYPNYGNTLYRQVQRGAKIPNVVSAALTAPSWSDNAARVILDYLTHPDGLGLSTSWITNAITEWEAAITVCNELVDASSSTTEVRYRIWNSYRFDERPADVLSRFLAACDGSLFPTPGRGLVLRVGKWTTPTVTIDGDAIIGFSEFGRGRDILSTANTIRARYLSPDHDYMETDADPWVDAADVAERGEYATDIDLFCSPSHGQTRRLMKLAAARLNPRWVGTLQCNLRALVVMGERYINVEIPELGIAETFEVLGVQLTIIEGSILHGLTVRVASLDSSAYAWDLLARSSEAGVPPPVPPPILPGPRSPEHLARVERERVAAAEAEPAVRQKEDAL